MTVACACGLAYIVYAPVCKRKKWEEGRKAKQITQHKQGVKINRDPSRSCGIVRWLMQSCKTCLYNSGQAGAGGRIIICLRGDRRTSNLIAIRWMMNVAADRILHDI